MNKYGFVGVALLSLVALPFIIMNAAKEDHELADSTQNVRVVLPVRWQSSSKLNQPAQITEDVGPGAWWETHSVSCPEDLRMVIPSNNEVTQATHLSRADDNWWNWRLQHVICTTP